MGNPGKRALPEPVLIAGRPAPQDLPAPEHLPADARQAWDEIVPVLCKVGILDRVDSLTLEMMCIQFARARQAGRVVALQGHLTRGSSGQIKEHPALKIEREASAMFLRFAEQYALTPSARTRLGMAELHRRGLQEELGRALGEVALHPVEDAAG